MPSVSPNQHSVILPRMWYKLLNQPNTRLPKQRPSSLDFSWEHDWKEDLSMVMKLLLSSSLFFFSLFVLEPDYLVKNPSLWFFHPGPKKECQHVHRLCFRSSVKFLMEICVLRPGWNWACNCNNISARWAEPNFSPGWNSPCNQAQKRN